MDMNRLKHRGVITTVILGIIIIGMMLPLIFVSYVVDGESMEPTLHDGNMLMVNKVAYGLKNVDRFDVVVFHKNEKEDYVKRVIGLPGDEIQYKNDKLYINGEYVEEEYLDIYKQKSDESLYTEDFDLKDVTGKQEVPKNSLFVMGDNRGNSLDSRTFGFIGIDELVGKVDVKYWPFEENVLVSLP